MLSATINRTVAKAAFDSMFAHSPEDTVLPPNAIVDAGAARSIKATFTGQNVFPLDQWLQTARNSAPSVAADETTDVIGGLQATLVPGEVGLDEGH